MQRLSCTLGQSMQTIPPNALSFAKKMRARAGKGSKSHTMKLLIFSKNSPSSPKMWFGSILAAHIMDPSESNVFHCLLYFVLFCVFCFVLVLFWFCFVLFSFVLIYFNLFYFVLFCFSRFFCFALYCFWFGLDWIGLVWFGLVVFGLVWFGLVWFDFIDLI